MTDRTKNWAEMAADCAIDAARATDHDNAMEWIGLGVASALLAIHDTLIADRYAANEAKQRGEAEPDPLDEDADKWQRAAFTLQGEQEHAVDRVADELNRIADDSQHEGWDSPAVRRVIDRLRAAGLTPYGLTLDPERAPGVLNWLGVNYYTPDSPHLPQPAAVVLPTVDEVADVLRSGDGLRFYSDSARDILDLIAARLPVWQPIEPGTVIKTGTRVREDWDDQITEWTLGQDEDPYASRSRSPRYWLDPRTVPAEPVEPVEPVDPRVAVVGEWLDSIGGEEHTADDVRDMLARLDALDGRADS